MQQPFLTEQTDIEKDTIERAEASDRIGAILQYARRPYSVRREVELGQCLGLRKVVELLVVALAAGKLLLPLFGGVEPTLKVVYRIHGARIVDAVGGDKRGVERARLRRMKD